MKEYVKQFKRQFILGPAFKLAEAILELFIPLLVAKIVDVGIANGDSAYILKTGALMILLGALGFSFAVICQYSAATAQQGMGTLLRRDLYQKIQSLSKEQQDYFSAGTLATRLINDVNSVQSAVAMFIRLAFRWPFIILGSLLAAAILDLKLSVIFFVAALLLSILLYFVLSRSLPIFRKIQEKTDILSAITEDSLLGVRVIRAFQKSKFHQKQFGDVNDKMTALSLRVTRLNACLNPLSFALLNLCIVLLIWFGGKRISVGTLTGGQLIALTNYMTQILLSIMIFSNVVVIFIKAAASVERIEEVLNTEPAMTEGKIEAFNTTKQTAISFKDVSFSYAKSAQTAVEHVTFDIPKGAVVGMIGATGSGKSTILKLLCRLYDRKSGEIRIFGEDVTAYTFAALHQGVHMVSQNNPLFAGTIYENLCCGRQDISKEEAKEALSLAMAEDFVSALPKGLDAPVLEGGQNFSGGQKQRLCIARALLGKAEILIFDDAFSALDFATESAILKNLLRTKEDKTLLFISQRVRALKGADEIILIEDGTLQGIGTHQALLKQNPLYQEICTSQHIVDEEVQK